MMCLMSMWFIFPSFQIKWKKFENSFHIKFSSMVKLCKLLVWISSCNSLDLVETYKIPLLLCSYVFSYQMIVNKLVMFFTINLLMDFFFHSQMLSSSFTSTLSNYIFSLFIFAITWSSISPFMFSYVFYPNNIIPGLN